MWLSLKLNIILPGKSYVMKKLILIACSFLFVLATQAQITKAELTATGLTCAMCSNAINSSLKELSYVDKVVVDIKKSEYRITFKEGAAVSIDGLKQAVEDAGFSVGKLNLVASFDNVTVANDAHVNYQGNALHFLATKNQTLNGEKTFTVVDKGFVTDKQFKKYAAATKMSCVQTGKAAGCCVDDNIKVGTRIYHVTI